VALASEKMLSRSVFSVLSVVNFGALPRVP